MLAVASLLFGLMAFFAKQATARLPGPEVAFVRFLFGLGAVAVVALAGRPLRLVNQRALVLRGLFGGVAVLLYFVAIAHLPVGTATLLNYTQPVFTTLAAALFLGEAASAATVLALALTLVGVALVVRGQAGPGSAGLGGFGPYEACALVSAVFSGAAVTAIRAARRTDGAWEIFGSLCLFGAAVTAPVALRGWVWPSARDAALLVAMGASATSAQVLYSHALRFVRAATAGVIGQLTPISAIALGALVLGDRLSLLALLGSAVTLGGVTLATVAGRPARRPPTAAIPRD